MSPRAWGGSGRPLVSALTWLWLLGGLGAWTVAGVLWALQPVVASWLELLVLGSGGLAALVLALALWAYMWRHPTAFVSWLSAPAWLLMILAITSFVAMNYTGTSTYTSLSGVKREMRVAVPLQIACAAIGVGVWLAGRFF